MCMHPAPAPVQGAEAEKRAVLQREREALPIWQSRTRLLSTVSSCRVLVLVGETGSGKTTQTPGLLLDAGLAGSLAVACTQPRRVAALSIAQRVAEERGSAVGEEVGYRIRFDDCSGPRTRLIYSTDGMLVREAMADPLLRKYGVVVLDEAHERTLATDVLFGVCKAALAQRSDLRLVVMSATLEAERFLRFFPQALAAYVPGRQFPVEVLYTRQPEQSYVDAAVHAAVQIHESEAEGDLLVFLTGQEEIEACERLIRRRVEAQTLPPVAIAPLFASLAPDRQLLAFQPAPPGARKIVLSTNLAETSVTVPGVRFVIDSGVVKASAFSVRAGAECLAVVPISQAAARQRSGRAGRTAPGRCFRLYTERAFAALAASTPPEMVRSPLATVVLQLKALGIRDLTEFEFLDPPPRPALLRALELLVGLRALDSQTGALTQPLGRTLAALPLDPRLGCVLVAACAGGSPQVLEDALALVSLAAAEGVLFLAPREHRDAALASHRAWPSGEGDHARELAVFRAFQEAAAAGRRRAEHWARERFLSLRVLHRASDVCQQLRRYTEGLVRAFGPGKSEQRDAFAVASSNAASSAGAAASSAPSAGAAASSAPSADAASSDAPSDTEALRKALVCGFFMHVARHVGDGEYRVLASGQRVWVHPSSVLAQSRADAICFVELVRTTKTYARGVSVVQVDWLADLVPHYFARRRAVEQEGAPAREPASA